MTIKYGLQFFFFELTDNDGQNFLAGIVHTYQSVFMLSVTQVFLFFNFTLLPFIDINYSIFYRSIRIRPTKQTFRADSMIKNKHKTFNTYGVKKAKISVASQVNCSRFLRSRWYYGGQ
jgi:hypothetical protein